MREIKFRAWNIDEKIMCYDNEDDSSDYWDGVISSRIGLINSFLGAKRWYKYMQCTGLKDMHGNEVYEGDFLLGFDDELTGVIKWCEESAAFSFESDTGGAYLSEAYLLNFKVIGNIYENPELLEGKS